MIENDVKLIWEKVKRTQNVFTEQQESCYGLTGHSSELKFWANGYWGEYMIQQTLLVVHSDKKDHGATVDGVEETLAKLFITACACFPHLNWETYQKKEKSDQEVIRTNSVRACVTQALWSQAGSSDPQTLIDLWTCLLSMVRIGLFDRPLKLEDAIDTVLIKAILELPTGIFQRDKKGNSMGIQYSMPELLSLARYTELEDELKDDERKKMFDLLHGYCHLVDITIWRLYLANRYGVMLLLEEDLETEISDTIFYQIDEMSE